MTVRAETTFLFTETTGTSYPTNNLYQITLCKIYQIKSILLIYQVPSRNFLNNLNHSLAHFLRKIAVSDEHVLDFFLLSLDDWSSVSNELADHMS